MSNYLVHSTRHKYIKKVKTKNGSWRYIYDKAVSDTNDYKIKNFNYTVAKNESDYADAVARDRAKFRDDAKKTLTNDIFKDDIRRYEAESLQATREQAKANAAKHYASRQMEKSLEEMNKSVGELQKKYAKNYIFRLYVDYRNWKSRKK